MITKIQGCLHVCTGIVSLPSRAVHTFSDMAHSLPPLKLKPEVEEYVKESYCNAQMEEKYGAEQAHSRFMNLLSRLSTPPCNTVVRVNTLHFTREDVRQRLQCILKEQYEDKSCPCPVVEPHPVLPDVLVIQGSGFNGEILPCKKEVIVDLMCGGAVLRGADVFVPGVMAAHPGIQVGDKLSVYADMDGSCRKGLTKPYEGNKVFLGNGIAQVSRADIFTGNNPASGVGVKMVETIYDAPSLNTVLPECMFLQNLPSVVVGHTLDPVENDCVLDMCAAPGGKTTHLAALMRDQGVIIAVDKSESKIFKVMANAARLGLHCIRAYAYNSTKIYDKDAVVGQTGDIGKPPYPAETFDKILLDGPCSALGQRPQLSNKMSLRDAKSYPPLQRKLFTNAVALLKTGGSLVYSTCTITLAENEQLVEWALRQFPELRLEKQSPHIGEGGIKGTSLQKEQRASLQRWDPASHRENLEREKLPCDSDTIGFFIAKFVKV
ncbi:tRNA (cytosine(72)-C(5))-methyltransferase NSUN6-like [Ptychodera flava]|uniref:tRNA (cytosine(72)-C(5))-methyltransferase NSUN6-like n=1 Tax=Ptychodera flava TaxID=63121 RepID=UPI00396A555A